MAVAKTRECWTRRGAPARRAPWAASAQESGRPRTRSRRAPETAEPPFRRAGQGQSVLGAEARGGEGESVPIVPIIVDRGSTRQHRGGGMTHRIIAVRKGSRRSPGTRTRAGRGVRPHRVVAGGGGDRLQPVTQGSRLRALAQRGLDPREALVDLSQLVRGRLVRPSRCCSRRERATNAPVIEAVITVTNPIPSSITTAAMIWPSAVVGT